MQANSKSHLTKQNVKIKIKLFAIVLSILNINLQNKLKTTETVESLAMSQFEMSKKKQFFFGICFACKI